MEGTGVYIFSNGERYEGQFVKGVREGVGKYTFFNGNYYQGDWANGKRHGYGRYYYFGTDEKYEGEFKNDDCNG